MNGTKFNMNRELLTREGKGEAEGRLRLTACVMCMAVISKVTGNVQSNLNETVKQCIRFISE